MEPKKRLFLLDAFALIFRGYYAFIKNPRINSKGLDTSAVMGFMNSLLDVIKKEKPDYLAVCFDRGGSSDRVEMFEEYKANRLETPEAISIAVPIIEELLEAMKIPAIIKTGFEADDIIGTLAKKAEKEGLEVYMVTPDKDFAQLVSDNIFMYKPPRMGNGYEKWGVEEVKAKFEVDRPEQVIDYLGMMGDAVDNIPGLPGVGDKTAKKFLKLYGSMEGLFENIHELKGKMKEKVEASQELGLLSKKLATIMLDVPVELEMDKLILEKPDFPKTKAVFERLEFRRMVLGLAKAYGEEDSKVEKIATKKITDNPNQYDLFAVPGSGAVTEEESTSGFKNIKTTNHFYQLLNTPLSRKLFLQKLMQQKSVCFTTDMSETKALELELVGISFSWENRKGYYLKLSKDREETKTILEEFRVFFEDENIEKVGHNLKYVSKVLSTYNIVVKGKLFDTMIAHYLINPDMRHDLEILSETYVNYQTIPSEEVLGKGKNKIKMRDVSVDNQMRYITESADIIFQLRTHFEKELAKGDLTELFETIEMPLVSVLAAMEVEGINIDTEFLKKLSIGLTEDIKELEQIIYKSAGEEFNIASPKQLGIVLFEKMNLVAKPKKTKTGQYSTNEQILSELAKEHAIISDILLFRQYKKLQSTYVDALPNELHPKDNRVHTIYAQAVASTGRLSSTNPNLQNIPIRTKRGQEVRKAFVPRDKDYKLLAADYSQIELRIIAALSEEKTMITAFSEGKDIHADTASKVFGVAIDEVTREQRSNAKTVNFGIIYGVSAFGLSNQTDLSRKEAKELIEAYYESYPKLKAYMEQQVNYARENGYVETVLGRKRYLKDINSRNGMVRSGAKRNAVNAPIQGSAADIIKLAMINIHKRFESEGFKTKMLLQVHDELVFDVYKEEMDVIKSVVKEEMENAFKMKVPLDVELGIGENWLEAH